MYMKNNLYTHEKIVFMYIKLRYSNYKNKKHG